jgi:formylglycine-generating enzyme required for sulfatase activity
MRADWWYEQAREVVPAGPLKTMVEERLADIAAKVDLENITGWRDQPPRAAAPFGEKRAKFHQKRWSWYLRLPVVKTNSIGMPLVLIPPGEFDMGSTREEIAGALELGRKMNLPRGYMERVPSESPRHRVKITKPFYLGRYTVTQREYEKVMGVNPSAFTAQQIHASAFQPPMPEGAVKQRRAYAAKVAGKDTSRHPVEIVNWHDANEFCGRLSAMPAERAARRVYRLPTEAEWEYACRAGTTTALYCGDDEAGLADAAWSGQNADGTTHPVGEKHPNAWGLFDMCGNVSQWCADWFGTDYYTHSPPGDPTGPAGGAGRLHRGGAWNFPAPYCRSACRPSDGPTSRTPDIGFRVVAEVAVHAGNVGVATPPAEATAMAASSPIADHAITVREVRAPWRDAVPW